MPASVQELSHQTVHAVQGKRQSDSFRHMTALSSGWSHTYKRAREEKRTQPPSEMLGHVLS